LERVLLGIGEPSGNESAKGSQDPCRWHVGLVWFGLLDLDEVFGVKRGLMLKVVL
jgi:hypothetical protein